MSDKDKQIANLRKNLAESIAKECKCENNTSVNHEVIDRNLKLREENKILSDAIDKYKEMQNGAIEK
jgi:hypothetical protein